MAPSAANAAAAIRTSLRPLAVPARAAWVTAARAAGGTAAATRVPAPEATAAASRWAAPGGAGRPARVCRVAVVTREAYRAPRTATPVAVPTWRRVFTPASKLSTVRWWAGTTLGADVGAASTDDIYAAMGWLAARQDAIEKRLAARHLGPEANP